MITSNRIITRIVIIIINIMLMIMKLKSLILIASFIAEERKKICTTGIFLRLSR